MERFIGHKRNIADVILRGETDKLYGEERKHV